MQSLADIATKKSSQEKITNTSMDLSKHKQEITRLKKKSALPKTDFQIRCEQGVSIEEARKQTHDFIEELWKRKK
jgi:hypothetical protein